jgi:hypothetical protein
MGFDIARAHIRVEYIKTTKCQRRLPTSLQHLTITNEQRKSKFGNAKFLFRLQSIMRSTLALLVAFLPATLAAECSPLHFVYARATTEPPRGITAADLKGPDGVAKFDKEAAKWWSSSYGAAGASLYSNITKLLPGTTGWGVRYPASFSGGSDLGVQDMINQLTKQSKACPEQKFAVGGHSQGGFVTVGAIPKLPKEILDKVVAVAMFGSPACPEQVKGRCISYCNKGDTVRQFYFS